MTLRGFPPTDGPIAAPRMLASGTRTKLFPMSLSSSSAMVLLPTAS